MEAFENLDIYKVTNSINKDVTYLISYTFSDTQNISQKVYKNYRVMVFTKDGMPNYSQKNNWVELRITSDINLPIEKIEELFCNLNRFNIESEMKSKNEMHDVSVSIKRADEELITSFSEDYKPILSKVLDSAPEILSLKEKLRELFKV
ncbi:hypothetical protein [Leptospira sp. id769339]|uniref:hypothetical protein n=1 Tax=Leptospira sp. id769339 TaxID=2864221 RepID=UPI00214B0B14|nr:hypothetical protein [Leptospira sp. id769339]MCR1794895.1 hypothetical protein [Leptospira sp. id769339]